jgi:hypothetical protein
MINNLLENIDPWTHKKIWSLKWESYNGGR